MWKSLSSANREEYKHLILAFASLTEMFAQKSDIEGKSVPVPIINSKYQETVFQKAFHASVEDVGNTSYDAAIHMSENGVDQKYLVGIKTFGFNSGDQKVAQFKANMNEWSEILQKIRENSKNLDEQPVKTKKEIDEINDGLYKELACRIAELRNKRIDSSKANLKGFKLSLADKDVEAVYHVLMPSNENNKA